MPRVVHVLRKFEPSEWGGIETYLLGLLPELERLGWKSEVHAPQEAGTDGTILREHGIGFRTVTVNSLRDVREEAAWPADLKWIRDSYPSMKGTPWFFLISGRTIQIAANSTDMWRTRLAPMAA